MVDNPSGGFSPDILSQFETYSTPLIADVIGDTNYVMSHQMKPVHSSMSVVGSALTVKSSPGDNLAIHKAISIATKHDVIVVDASGYPDSGIWGELLSIAALEAGVEGVVIDGAVRDTREIGDLGFPVFSCYVSPMGSTKNDPGPVNQPISCADATVSPGDVIVGDTDGVVVIPQESATSVLDKSAAKAADEQEYRSSGDVFETYANRYDDFSSDQ